MKFYSFPGNMEISLIYSSKRGFESKLFRNLIIQCSPTGSWFIRLITSELGFYLGSLFKLQVQVPIPDVDYIGIVKSGTNILFELKNGEPKSVWRTDASGKWKEEQFVGYQLVSDYSTSEFEKKYPVIEQALKTHWNSLKQDSLVVHGDLTHFNILLDDQNQLHFIDQKPHENSRLFDFFYFFSYLKQCVSRCQTLSNDDKEEIIDRVESIIKNVYVYENVDQLKSDLENIQVQKTSGLIKENTENYLVTFRKIFDEQITK